MEVYTPVFVVYFVGVGAIAGLIVAVGMAADGLSVWWCLGTVAACMLASPVAAGTLLH